MFARFPLVTAGSSRLQLRLVAGLFGVAVVCVVLPAFVLAGRMAQSARGLADREAARVQSAADLEGLLRRHRSLVMQALDSRDEAGRRMAAGELAGIGAGLPGIGQLAVGGDGGLGREMVEAFASLLRAGDEAVAQSGRPVGSVPTELAASRYEQAYEFTSEVARRGLAGLNVIVGERAADLSARSASLAWCVLGAGFVLVGVGSLVLAVGRRTERRVRQMRDCMLQMAILDGDGSVPFLADGDEIGSMARAVEVFRDLARRVTAQNERLQGANVRLEGALSNMSQGICMFDAFGKVELFNRHLCTVFGFGEGDLRCDMTAAEFLRRVLEAGGVDQPEIDGMVRDRLATIDRKEAGSWIEKRSDGRLISVHHWPLSNGGHAATFDDVTDRRAADAQIVYMARHDGLTGLPNRLVLQERIEQELVETGRGGRSAVLLLDVDHFKRVNDALGHPVGDGLLRAVSDRLLACVREGDMVARLGGDEFAIVQAGITRPEDAKLLSERIITTLSHPYVVEGHEIVVGASIGLALLPDDGTDAATLLKNADMALYRAKQEERGTFSFFEAGMDARLQLRRQLEVDLRKGLADEEFELYYQPMVNPVTEQVVGFEALLRWQHPTRGMVSPVEFIPIVEEIGLIIPLGEWVIRTACREAASWPGEIKVALNLSPIQFRSRNLVPTVASALEEAGLAANRLELEVTETLLLQESESTISMLHGLRALGARISMDDFGTGYSSLSYLRRFPFDKIKIDQSFIRDLSRREDAIHIVRAIRGLCAGLGMKTTAEGIETEEEFAKIRSEGCTEAQGYLFSPPRPARDVISIIDRIRSRTARLSDPGGKVRSHDQSFPAHGRERLAAAP